VTTCGNSDELASLAFCKRRNGPPASERFLILEEDRGFGAWVEETSDISRCTTDRWCERFADEYGIKDPTFGHVSKSDVVICCGIQNR